MRKLLFRVLDIRNMFCCLGHNNKIKNALFYHPAGIFALFVQNDPVKGSDIDIPLLLLENAYPAKTG